MSVDADPIDPETLAQALRGALGSGDDPESRLSLDPETVERDMARLVLGLCEFLRKLLELQAIRRVERGTLSAEQEERLGLALMRAETRLHEMAEAFGLSPADLSLDLGPLGRTV